MIRAENIVFYLHELIIQYEKITDEKPYIILITPKNYLELRKVLEETNMKRYLAKLGTDKDKINYIFGIPVEISNHLIQEAICLNQKDYHKYCEERYAERIKAREKECIDKYLNMSKYASEMEGKYITEKYIIDELEKFFKNAYDNEVRPLNDRKISVWTICLDKLKELKENKYE